MKIPQLRPRHWVAIGLGVSACFALLVIMRQGEVAPRFMAPPEPEFLVSTGTVKAGDVFESILKRSGIPAAQIPQVQSAFGKVFGDLRHIKPDENYDVVFSTTGIFQKFVYRKSPVEWINVAKDSGTFVATKETMDTVWREKRVEGTVTESINQSLIAQGLPAAEVGAIVGDLTDNIMGWRIDFFTEQRKGDTFEILMEQQFPVDSDKPLWRGKPRILAFRYTGSGTRAKENLALRYQEPGSKEIGYYDEKGNATRRAFLRAPFTNAAFRVSSRFNPRRMHPILRTYRPHHGTDYAAARGTPVAAIGSGTVIRAESYKGYGNCVDIRHPNGFVSRYGHLSAINVRRGQSVLQGRLVGRVGSTGLSTGPHLHFEMLVGGKQQDFLRMNFPAASSVKSANMPHFSVVRDELIARMDANKPPKTSTEPVKVAAR